MLRARRAGIATLLAVAALAAVTAGCGGGGGNNSSHSALPLDPVAAAATKSQNAGAARIRFTMAIGSGQSQGKAIRVNGTGAIDGTSSQMTFKLGSMVGQTGIPAAAVKKLAHASIKGISLEENGDFVLYMHFGFLTSQIPGHKPWLKLDLSKFGKAEGLGSLLSGSQFEPSDLLGMLKAEGATVHKVGEATVDGVSTTHFRVAIDLAKVFQSKGLTSPLLKSMAARMKTAYDDVWIGKDGLVRRIRTAYSMPTLNGAPRMSMTMDIYDYGAHVTIAAPPSSEVYDGTQLAQQGVANSLP